MISRRLISGLATGTLAATALGAGTAIAEDPGAGTDPGAAAPGPAAPTSPPAGTPEAPPATAPVVPVVPVVPVGQRPQPDTGAAVVPPGRSGSVEDDGKARLDAAKKKLLAERKRKRQEKDKAEDSSERPADDKDSGDSATDPTTADALLAPGVGTATVPSVLLRNFRIPPFLLSIYQAAGVQYGIRWEILAAINEIETDYGRNVAVSSAGAQGWMQFMPATWAQYGVDANRDGQRDPYNPVDAIFAAARYLKASGAAQDIRRAIFAYNRADWYVDSVILRAKLIGRLPDAFIGSLTGLTQGRFPVYAKATYDRVSDTADGRRRRVSIVSEDGAPVIAVQDARVVNLGTSRKLGRYVRLQDVFGNTYTYGGLGEIARTYRLAGPVRTGPVTPARRSETTTARNLVTMAAGVRRRGYLPTGTAGRDVGGESGIVARPVSATPDLATLRAAAAATVARRSSEPLGTPRRVAVPPAERSVPGPLPVPRDATPATEADPLVLAATGTPFGPIAVPQVSPAPEPEGKVAPAAPTAKPTPTPTPGATSATTTTTTSPDPSVVAAAPAEPVVATSTAEVGATARYRPSQPTTGGSTGSDGRTRDLVRGALVPSGTVIGRLRDDKRGISRLKFEIRPAGKGSPRIDPGPLLDGWRLLETTAIYRAASGTGLSNGRTPAAAGQVLLLGKSTLQRRVLSNPRISVYACGRQDIAAGLVDRRILAVLEFLAASGLEPTVSSLRCGRRSRLTASGNVSAHPSGNAVDIPAINGTPILGNQGAGTITDRTVQRLATLQGVSRPRQIISLMTIAGADNTLALPDHNAHIHVGFDPQGSDSSTLGAQTAAILAPGEWATLGRRLADITLPKVPRTPSDASLPVEKPRASGR